MFSHTTRYQLLLHLVVLIFGFTAILGKLISVDAWMLVWYRLLIAVAGIGVYMLIRRRRFTLPPRAVIIIAATGLLIAAHWVLFFAAIKASNVSITLVCLSVAPLIVAFIEPLVFGRRVRQYEVVLSILVVMGLAFIFRIESGHRSGIILALSATLLSSIFVVINAVLVKQYNASVISFYELLGGLVGISLYLAGIGMHPWGFSLSWQDLIYLLILGLLCTAFAYIAAIEVMKTLSPYTVMLTVNMEPVYGIILALLIFGESEIMRPGFYAGAGLILLTILGNAMLKRGIQQIPLDLNKKAQSDYQDT